tara:strand:+ start:181 stop:729 length:549 start_codon:yes stop_codon:yes gene_type:complete
MNLNIFCTKIKIIKNFFSQTEINNALDLLKNTKQESHVEFIGNHTSSYYSFNNFLKNTNLENKINNEVLKYSADCILAPHKIYRSWINVQKKDSVLKMHNHYPGLISGIIWLKTDSDSSNLVFENPNPFVKNITKIDEQYFSIKPNQGTLIVFPGWLTHGSNYEKNKSEERIVLSFNCTEAH